MLCLFRVELGYTQDQTGTPFTIWGRMGGLKLAMLRASTPGSTQGSLLVVFRGPCWMQTPYLLYYLSGLKFVFLQQLHADDSLR